MLTFKINGLGTIRLETMREGILYTYKLYFDDCKPFCYDSHHTLVIYYRGHDNKQAPNFFMLVSFVMLFVLLKLYFVIVEDMNNYCYS